MNLAEAVKTARKGKGYRYSQDDLAADVQRAGFKSASRNWVANIESGRRKGLFPEEFQALAKALGKPIEYFGGVRDISTPHRVAESSPKYDATVYPLPPGMRMEPVPIRGMVSASGVDYQPDEPPRGFTPFVIEWPRRGQLDALLVSGDSMAPTVHAGEYVIVRRDGHEAVREGALVIVRVDGQLFLKRIYRDGDAVILKCDNPKHKSRRYAASHVEVLGVAIMAQEEPRRL